MIVIKHSLGGLKRSKQSNTLKDMGSMAADSADSALGQMIGGSTAPIGNVYKIMIFFNPDYLSHMVKSTFEQGLNIGVNEFVGGLNRPII